MAALDLTKYGITGVTEILHNPSYEVLFEEENKPGLEGFDKGQLTELDAMNVMTGIYTGRSPKDKYIVMDKNSKDTVWWTTDGYKNDNHPLSEENWAKLKVLAQKQLSGKRLFVMDAFCGANKDTGWPSASSWKWPGRLTSSRTCSSSPARKNWPPLSLTSSCTPPPRARWTIIKPWA